MAKFCTNCGAEISEGYAFCEQCGTPVDEKGNAHGNNNKASQGNGGTPVNVYNNTVIQQKKGNGLAVAGFVISLVNAILCCGSFSLISLIFSIVGVVKAKDCNGEGKGLAIAGIIISALCMVGWLIYIIIFGIAGFASVIEEGY